MTRLAVIGPGAIGGMLAAWLAQVPGNEVTVCVRTPFERLLVEVPGGAVLDVLPRVWTDPVQASPVDWVLAVTKTYATEGAKRWVERLRGPETRVAVVQNGVEHIDRFRGVVPAERTLPVIIDVPAERSAPGRIRQRGHGQTTVPAGALGRDFARLFAGTPVEPVLSDDFLSATWRKLVLNSAGAVNALTLRPNGVVQNAKAAGLIRDIAAESLAVGRAVGAQLSDALPDEIVERYRASQPDAVNSLLADRLAGRATEIDARNGIIVRLGAAHGVPTPLNAMAVAVIEASAS